MAYLAATPQLFELVDSIFVKSMQNHADAERMPRQLSCFFAVYFYHLKYDSEDAYI